MPPLGPRATIRRPRRPRSTGTAGPRSEAAAGGGYGIQKAAAFKRTAPYRGAVRAAYTAQPTVVRSQQARQAKRAPISPDAAAIIKTHADRVRGLVKRKHFEATFTGLSEYGRQREQTFQRQQDVLSKSNQERVYNNAQAAALRGQHDVAGNNPELNAITAYASPLAAQRAVQAGKVDLGPTGLGKTVRPPEAIAKERAMTKLAVDASKAGASMPQITKALTALDKRHKAPELTVLEQFHRPISAVAGGFKGGLKGAVKGAISNKEDFSKILKDAGYGKGVSVGAGLVLDIALDPTTYLSFGAGRPALAAARSAAEQAARHALDQGLEHAAVEAAAHSAAERAFAAHGAKGVGIKVGLRGAPVRIASTAKNVVKGQGLREAVSNSTREVMSSGAASSRLVGTPAAKVTGAVAKRLPERLKTDLDQIGQSLIHSYRPRGFTPVQWERMRSSARQYRAGMSKAERVGETRMQVYRHDLQAAKVPAERHAAIIDAVEVRDVGRLPEHERPIAEAMLRDAESMASAETKAGVRKPGEVVGERPGTLPGMESPEATGYVARYTRGDLTPDEALRVYHTEPGGRKVASTSLRQRKERLPLAEQAPENRARLIQDIPTIMGERTAEGERLRTLSKFNDQMAAHGTPVEHPDQIDLLVDHTTGLPDPLDMQRFYVRGPRGDLTPVWRTVDRVDQLQERLHNLVESGQHVVEVPRTTVEAMWGLAKRGRMPSAAGKAGRITHLFWDEPTRKWKWLVTQPNPGYHVRNLIGDAWNARLGGATTQDMGAALRMISRHRKHLDGLSKDMLRGIADDVTPETLQKIGRTERYGSNGDLSDGQVLLLAEQHGAVRAGQIARELRDLRRGTAIKAQGRARRTLQAFSESREDLMRLASFRRALKRGDSPEAAAAWANKHHFDYSDLTDTEVSALRRIMPFYTWTARNTPRQLASLLQTPGRFASLEKVRRASADAAGLPQDWALTMPEYVQASAPLAIPSFLPGARQAGLPMLGSASLPVTDINNITPHMALARLEQSITPFIKLPLEYRMKYDFYYRDKIRKDLVPAPAYVADPGWQKAARLLVGALPGVGKPTFDYITDRRTGKRVIAWPWWMDKLARQTPMSGVVTGLTTEGRERRPGDKLTSLTNWLTGVRRQAISPSEARTTQLFEDLQNVEKEIGLAGERRTGKPGSPHGGKLKELDKRRAQIQSELNLATTDFAAPYFPSPARKKKAAKFGQTSASSHFGSGNFGKPSGPRFGSGQFGSQ